MLGWRPGHSCGCCWGETSESPLAQDSPPHAAPWVLGYIVSQLKAFPKSLTSCPSIDHLQLTSVYGLELGFVPFPPGRSAHRSCGRGLVVTQPGVVNQRAASGGIFQLCLIKMSACFVTTTPPRPAVSQGKEGKPWPHA